MLSLVLATAAARAQQSASTQAIGLTMYLQGGYAGIKTDLTQAAELMPEEDYCFVPSSMPEVRTYGQIFTHVAAAQFGACAVAKGVPNPNAGCDLEQELTTKARIVTVLADSFAFCDEAFSFLTESNATELVKQGRREIARSAVLVGILAHGAEMYGISTVYLRAKNLVPPSTERQLQRQRSR